MDLGFCPGARELAETERNGGVQARGLESLFPGGRARVCREVVLDVLFQKGSVSRRQAAAVDEDGWSAVDFEGFRLAAARENSLIGLFARQAGPKGVDLKA